MIIKNFTISNIDMLYRDGKPIEYIQYANETELKELLSVANVSFYIKDATRLQSTLICELGDSYVQQSQRYVKSDNYSIDTLRDTDIYDKANQLVQKSISLYERMTELKKPDKKGRLTAVDFKYGIPYEDARYILPLAMKTNIKVSMSGDKLIDLYKLFLRHSILFTDNLRELLHRDHKWLHKLIIEKCKFSYTSNISRKIYEDVFKDIKSDEVLIVDDMNSVDNVVLGGLTSTNIDPEEALMKMDYDSKELFIDRVAYGYGHSGILEQSRNTVGMCLSLSSYHQYIRHRLNKNIRENLSDIALDRKRGFYIPRTIYDSVFLDEYTELVNEYYKFLKTNCKGMHIDRTGIMLLNCMYVKFISSSNARNDAFLFRERLCQNAQTEIRELMDMKYWRRRKSNPALYKKAVPPCVYGQCKEGKMTCGYSPYMRGRYGK